MSVAPQPTVLELFVVCMWLFSPVSIPAKISETVALKHLSARPPLTPQHRGGVFDFRQHGASEMPQERKESKCGRPLKWVTFLANGAVSG